MSSPLAAAHDYHSMRLGVVCRRHIALLFNGHPWRAVMGNMCVINVLPRASVKLSHSASLRWHAQIHCRHWRRLSEPYNAGRSADGRREVNELMRDDLWRLVGALRCGRVALPNRQLKAAPPWDQAASSIRMNAFGLRTAPAAGEEGRPLPATPTRPPRGRPRCRSGWSGGRWVRCTWVATPPWRNRAARTSAPAMTQTPSSRLVKTGDTKAIAELVAETRLPAATGVN